jgi:multiple sugar transport system ATP-binding protein
MDEPLSNLDAKLRVQMRAEIARIQKRLGTTTLYVTHDQVEAMTMADRVAVMRRGVLQQVAAPPDLYDRPDNLFVAGFIGSPPMNLFNGRLVETTAGMAVTFGSLSLSLPGRDDLRARVDQEVVLGIRPEDVEDAEFDRAAPADHRLHVVVELVEQLGSDVLVHAVTDAVAASGEQVAEAVEQAHATASPGAPLIARCNPRSRPRLGSTIELTVDARRVHLFEPVTGERLRPRAEAGQGASVSGERAAELSREWIA